MSEKKRYIIGHRHGPRLDVASSQNIDTYLTQHKEAVELRRTSVGRRVIEMTTDQMRDLAGSNPDLVIEEDEELELAAMPGLPARLPMEGAFSLDATVKDATTGQPIPYVTLYAVGLGITYKALTNENGRATLHTSESSIRHLIVSPRDTYWSKVLPSMSIAGNTPALEITLKPLMVTGAYTWGHRLMGFRAAHPLWTGAGVKVAVIDSGITNQHEDLHIAGGYNTLEGQDVDAWHRDEKGHGTHVAGVIAAQNNTIGVVGGAPQAEVFSIRVFPGGRLSDLVEAVEWCIRNRIDVISISLGGKTPSHVLASVLRDAYDRGITCVAAAGNNSTHVSYPAAFPMVIGVGAIGRFGTFPEDSGHTLKSSMFVDRAGGLFAASFTNFGPEIDVCAPGVAVLSTVPTGYAVWDGTSMACPFISALVALVIEAYPSIRTGNPQQVEWVRSILLSAAVDLGLPPLMQGWGLPLVQRALPMPPRILTTPLSWGAM